jgi:hypothetical protein
VLFGSSLAIILAVQAVMIPMLFQPVFALGASRDWFESFDRRWVRVVGVQIGVQFGLGIVQSSFSRDTDLSLYNMLAMTSLVTAAVFLTTHWSVQSYASYRLKNYILANSVIQRTSNMNTKAGAEHASIYKRLDILSKMCGLMAVSMVPATIGLVAVYGVLGSVRVFYL